MNVGICSEIRTKYFLVAPLGGHRMLNGTGLRVGEEILGVARA
jgi:hypothetical protein